MTDEMMKADLVLLPMTWRSHLNVAGKQGIGRR